VLADHDVTPSGQDKTSLVIATKNVPGAMVSVLEPLSKNKVSMTKLESRPAKMGLWEYVFFVDVEGHYQDINLKKRLLKLSNVHLLLRF
jgi:chorismate mutase/prephenate dehydratase